MQDPIIAAVKHCFFRERSRPSGSGGSLEDVRGDSAFLHYIGQLGLEKGNPGYDNLEQFGSHLWRVSSEKLLMRNGRGSLKRTLEFSLARSLRALREVVFQPEKAYLEMEIG